MPEVTTAQIKAKLVELRERLAALTAEISAMPEGSARDLAALERETAENLMAAIENRRTEGSAFATLLARMQYIYQAKAGELAPDEIETKAAAMGKNRRFVDTFARGTSNDARMGLLDTLFGGTRTEHITSWLRDIENNVTVDYAAAFETLCTEPEGEVEDEDAVEEGWAPAPTNAVQKKIWTDIKAKQGKSPTNPIKIVPGQKPSGK